MGGQYLHQPTCNHAPHSDRYQIARQSLLSLWLERLIESGENLKYFHISYISYYSNVFSNLSKIYLLYKQSIAKFLEKIITVVYIKFGYVKQDVQT